jgi:hypothetical protein
MSNDKLIAQAFDAAAKACGGKPRMLAALNISESWMYACMKKNNVPLITALQLQYLTKLQFRWQDLAPEDHKKITDCSKYVIETE